MTTKKVIEADVITPSVKAVEDFDSWEVYYPYLGIWNYDDSFLSLKEAEYEIQEDDRKESKIIHIHIPGIKAKK